MPRNNVACVLCGAPISEELGTWMAEFRALFTDDHEWTNVRLSGVGTRSILFDYAPVDPSSRHDDPNFDRSRMIDIWLQQSTFSSTPSPVPPAIEQSAWGFPFHAACWELNSRWFEPAKPDIQSLFEICLSLPLQRGYLDWGHSYGGLLRTQVDEDMLLPGEERTLGSLDYDHILRTSAGVPVYAFNPLAIPELEQLVDQSHSATVDSNAIAQDSGIQVCAKPDCFGNLPIEILQMILHMLPSRDVLSLKLASSVAAAMPLTNSFWASRFSSGHENEYIFEARDRPRHAFSWKVFYFGVKSLNNIPNILNRRRIWRLFCAQRKILHDTSSSPCDGVPIDSFFEPNERKDELHWMTASRAVVDPEDFFDTGCRALRVRELTISQTITSITISFMEFRNQKYISGFLFRQRNGVEISLGYVKRRHAVFIASEDLWGDLKAIRISGFVLAMDLSGLRAISFLSIFGQTSKWFGEHEGIPKKRLIIGKNGLRLLKGEFDAIKLVSLAVPAKPAIDAETSSYSPTSSLRDKVFWLPDIPPEGLSFEDHTKNCPWQAREKRPYNMVLFGGCRGEQLPKLTQIVVWLVDICRIYGIEFRYKTEVNGCRSQTLGRLGPFSNAEPREFAPFDNSTDQRIVFDIDGPGGEAISNIELRNTEWGQLTGFRLLTNRRRVVTFPPPELDEDDRPYIPVDVADRVIVGLYAFLETAVVVKTLGVIMVE